MRRVLGTIIITSASLAGGWAVADGAGAGLSARLRAAYYQDGATGGGSGLSDAEAAAKLAEDETLEQISKIPTEEKKTRAGSMLEEMQSALRRATEILGEANANNDVVQLNCITEKLNQITSLVEIGETSSATMLVAIANAKETSVNHEFAKLSIAHTKVVVLRAEADQCVGEAAIYTGSTQITTENDANRNQKDPTKDPGTFYPATTELASKF